MATDIREVLSQYVGQAQLDQAVEDIRDTEIAPEWFRSEAAKLGDAAKRADEAEARLASIESAPKLKEALKRVGIDYDAQPKYGQKTLDNLPADKLDDLTFVAQFVNDEGFEAVLADDGEVREKSGAEQITDALVSIGSGGPVKGGVTPADFAKWDTPKQREFMNKFPAAYEALTRGQVAQV